MLRLKLVLLFLIAWFYVYSQQSVWVNIDHQIELPDPNITGLVKASNGLLYVGTAVGLYSFDGFAFTKVELDTTKLLNPYVFELLANDEFVYVGLRNGLARVNLATNSHQLVLHDFMKVGGSNMLALNNDGSKLLVRTAKAWLKFACEANRFAVEDTLEFDSPIKDLVFDDNDYQGFSYKSCFVNVRPNAFNPLLCDPAILDATWINADKKWIYIKQDAAYLFDPNSNQSQKLIHQFDVNKIENNWLYPDQRSGVWVKTNNGFDYLESIDSQSFTHFENENGNPYSFSSNSAQAFHTDNDLTIWAGSDGKGFGYITKGARELCYLSNESVGAGNFWCFKIEKTSKLFLAGTSNGILMADFNHNHIQNSVIYKPLGYDRFLVNGICCLNNSEYLISVHKAGVWTFNATTKAFKQLTAINKATGNLFVFGLAEFGEELILYTDNCAFTINRKTMRVSRMKSNNNYFNSIYKVVKNSHGEYMVGSGFGMMVYDSLLNQTGYYSSRTNIKSAPPSEVIFDISELKNGNYLLATMGAGLCEFNQTTGKFKRIDVVLKPDNIFGIIAADGQRFLLGTSKGLCLFDYKSGKSTMLNRSNLLPFNDFNQSATYRAGNLAFFGGEKGMLMLDLTKLDALFNEKLRIVARYNNQQVNHLLLGQTKRNLQLKLSFSKIVPVSKLKFKYRIKGLDHQWQYLPYGQNVLTYNYLPTGSYVLQVFLIDETNFCNAVPLELPIVVKPYYFETLWFKLAAFLFIVVVIFFIVKRFTLVRLRWKLMRMDAERKIMLERSRISRELHDNLGSQLTYMISGLETTEWLLKMNQPEKTLNSLEKMQLAARESMQQLRDSIWALHPGKMSLNSMVSQFEKWTSRAFEDNVNTKHILEKPKCQNFEIDPLVGLNIFRIMQEAANNALKHAEAKNILTSIQCIDGELIITITDDGKGYALGQNIGTGTLSMQQRSDAIHAQYSVDSQIGLGTQLQLRIPVNRLKD